MKKCFHCISPYPVHPRNAGFRNNAEFIRFVLQCTNFKSDDFFKAWKVICFSDLRHPYTISGKLIRWFKKKYIIYLLYRIEKWTFDTMLKN